MDEPENAAAAPLSWDECRVLSEEAKAAYAEAVVESREAGRRMNERSRLRAAAMHAPTVAPPTSIGTLFVRGVLYLLALVALALLLVWGGRKP